MGQEYKYMIATRCMTYNHTLYIEDALRGFTMQKTTFPVVYIITDDASTDGEPEVLRKWVAENLEVKEGSVLWQDLQYGQLVEAQLKGNPLLTFVILLLTDNHYTPDKRPLKLNYIKEWEKNAKYIAFCEGDDFWNDPFKLQMQVDALDNNTNCSIAYCRVQKVKKDGSAIKKQTIPDSKKFHNGYVTLNDFCNEEYYRGYWCFHTSSFLIRREYVEMSPERESFFSIFPYGDMPTQLWCLLHGDGFFVNSICSSYRIMSGGYNSLMSANKELAIMQTKKLINALRFLDSYTMGQFSKAIKRQILRKELQIDEMNGIYLAMYRSKYIPIIMQNSIKYHISYILSKVFPSFHSLLKTINNKIK